MLFNHTAKMLLYTVGISVECFPMHRLGGMG